MCSCVMDTVNVGWTWKCLHNHHNAFHTMHACLVHATSTQGLHFLPFFLCNLLQPRSANVCLSSMHTIMRSSVELPSRLAIIWRLQVCVVVSHDSLRGCSIIVNDIFWAIWWFHHLMDRKVMMTRRFLNTQNISVFSWEAGWKQQT